MKRAYLEVKRPWFHTQHCKRRNEREHTKRAHPHGNVCEVMHMKTIKIQPNYTMQKLQNIMLYI